jgi:hypothetical protein
MGGGGCPRWVEGARVDLRCRQCKPASVRRDPANSRQNAAATAASRVCLGNTTKQSNDSRSSVALVHNESQKSSNPEGTRLCGKRRAPGVPYIGPRRNFASLLLTAMRSEDSLTHTHTLLGLPRPGPTGWLRRGSQWCQLLGYRGFLPLCAGAGKSRKSLWSRKVGRLFFLARVWIPAPRDGRSPVAWRRYCLMGPGLTICGGSRNGAPPLNPPNGCVLSAPPHVEPESSTVFQTAPRYFVHHGRQPSGCSEDVVVCCFKVPLATALPRKLAFSLGQPSGDLQNRARFTTPVQKQKQKEKH